MAANKPTPADDTVARQAAWLATGVAGVTFIAATALTAGLSIRPPPGQSCAAAEAFCGGPRTHTRAHTHARTNTHTCTHAYVCSVRGGSVAAGAPACECASVCRQGAAGRHAPLCGGQQCRRPRLCLLDRPLDRTCSPPPRDPTQSVTQRERENRALCLLRCVKERDSTASVCMLVCACARVPAVRVDRERGGDPDPRLWRPHAGGGAGPHTVGARCHGTRARMARHQRTSPGQPLRSQRPRAPDRSRRRLRQARRMYKGRKRACERERERVCVCVCVCEREQQQQQQIRALKARHAG
jgi:hypothetical protein